MADDKKATTAPEKTAEPVGFLFRITQKPRRSGEKKPLDVRPSAKCTAFVHGETYSELTQTVGEVNEKGAATLKKKKVKLTPKLCEELKAIMEEQWGGPSFDIRLQVSFTPVLA